MSDAPKPEEKLTPATVFERLLAYADKPWKAVVVVVLVVVCGFGYLLWDQRARLADMVLHAPYTKPALDIARFARDADTLLRDTRGDVAVLIELHLVDNISIDRIGFDRDGNRWVPIDGPQQAIAPDGSTAMIARFLRNEVICFDTQGAVTEEARALLASGYTRACLVSVPPIIGVGVGGLLVAWKMALVPSIEARASIVMSSAAMKFATW